MRRVSATALVTVLVLGACGGGDDDDDADTPTEETTTTAGGGTTELGPGVDADSVKIAVSLVDFDCIKPFVDEIRLDQEETYQAFIDDVNENGGINGRTLETVFKTHCPIPGQEPSSLTNCTSATEDDNVFAIVGLFVDFSGDAHLCVTREHQRVLITHMLSQAWIDEAPPALLLSPDITAERRIKVVMSLLANEGTLDGRTVAVLAEGTTEDRIDTAIGPALEEMDVERGSDAVLSITGADTTAAQAQLESFIEKWKSENVDALILSGATMSAKQFVERIKGELPEVVFVADHLPLGQAQDEVEAGVQPNPYEGLLAAEGETGTEHAAGPEAKECHEVYTSHTGKSVPAPTEVIEGPDGKRLDIYGAVGDACVEVRMFADIAEKVGPDLNVENWTKTVNGLGPIRIMSTKYASLGEDKYDADDTYRLVAFDSSVGEKGDWRGVTPVRDVSDL